MEREFCKRCYSLKLLNILLCSFSGFDTLANTYWVGFCKFRWSGNILKGFIMLHVIAKVFCHHHGCVYPEGQRATSRFHEHQLVVIVAGHMILYAHRSSLKVNLHVFLGWPGHLLPSRGTQSMLKSDWPGYWHPKDICAKFSLCSVMMPCSGCWLTWQRASTFVRLWWQLMPSIFHIGGEHSVCTQCWQCFGRSHWHVGP